MESTPTTGPLISPCKKCNKNEATLTSRAHAVCVDCFVKYVAGKCAKQLGTLSRQVRPLEGTGTRRVLVGLSFGVSSTVLLEQLHENALRSLAEGQKLRYEVTAIHVDADSSAIAGVESPRIAAILERYRVRYPHFSFNSVPIVSVLGLRTVDWSTLPSFAPDQDASAQMRTLFDHLPSTTSKADVLRMFTRHILIYKTLQESCQLLLLGYCTTSLAELTLAETAKGRGFSLAWQVHDGNFPVLDYQKSEGDSHEDGRRGKQITTIPIYSPLRDLLRNELVTYASLLSPPLTEIVSGDAQKQATVVSHKDLSIEEVMARYFEEVELNYPSVVANVVKTTGKLARIGAAERCGLCSMPLDEQGDERWRGEIGDNEGAAVWSEALCYGCKRSVGG